MGLPGVRGIEHIGLTVPDLEEAVRFLVDVVGCTFVFDGGRHGDDPAFFRDRLGVPETASLRYVFLRLGHGPNLEVFEYAAPGQAITPPLNSDIGGHHLAIYVDDFDAALAALDAAGVEVMRPVSYIEDGPAMGSRWVYFRAPWGLQLELVSWLDGKGAPDSPARRLWHPAAPER